MDNIILNLKDHHRDEKYYSKQKIVLNKEHDSIIEFNEDKHIYKINGIKANFSITTFLNNLYDSFDSHKVSLKCAEKWKSKERPNVGDSIYTKQMYILSEYKYAAYLGTCVHKQIESILNSDGRKLPNCDMDPTLVDETRIYHEPALPQNAIVEFQKEYGLCKLFDGIKQRLAMFKNFYRLFKPEFLVSEYMIWTRLENRQLLAGCIDAIFWDDKEKRSVFIVDWKTNKNLISMYKNKIKNETSPFHNELKSTLDKYECQLHGYANILENNYSVIVSGALIVNLTNDNFIVFHATDHKMCKCKTLYRFSPE